MARFWAGSKEAYLFAGCKPFEVCLRETLNGGSIIVDKAFEATKFRRESSEFDEDHQTREGHDFRKHAVGFGLTPRGIPLVMDRQQKDCIEARDAFCAIERKGELAERDSAQGFHEAT